MLQPPTAAAASHPHMTTITHEPATPAAPSSPAAAATSAARSAASSPADGLHVIVHANGNLARAEDVVAADPPRRRQRRGGRVRRRRRRRHARRDRRAARRRPDPGRRQQRRHPRRRADGRHERRAVEARDRRVAARLLPRHPAAAAADGAHALGPHRQRVVGGGGARQPRPGQLRRGEVGVARRHRNRWRARWPRAASPSTWSRRA